MRRWAVGPELSAVPPRGQPQVGCIFRRANFHRKPASSELDEVCRHLQIMESTWHRWLAQYVRCGSRSCPGTGAPRGRSMRGGWSRSGYGGSVRRSCRTYRQLLCGMVTVAAHYATPTPCFAQPQSYRGPAQQRFPKSSLVCGSSAQRGDAQFGLMEPCFCVRVCIHFFDFLCLWSC